MMKRKPAALLLCSIYCLLALCPLTLINEDQNLSEASVKTSAQDLFADLNLNDWEAPDYMQYDMERRIDPSTGDVPSQRRWQILRDLREQGYENRYQRRAADASYGWQVVNDYLPNLAVSRLVSDPNDPQTFYFCTGEGWFNADAVRGDGVFRSTDAGQTWEQLASTANNQDFYYCQDMLVHPSTGDIYVATRAAGVQRSSDGGETWSQVLGSGNGSSNNAIADLALTADGEIFAGIGIFSTDGIYFSETGDVGSWTKQTNGFPGSNIWRIIITTSPSDPNRAYAVPMRASDGLIDGFYRTEDKGTTWVEVENPGGDRNYARSQAWYDLSLAVDPNDPDVVVTGGLNIWRSRDGGDSWQQLSAGRPDGLTIRYMHVDQHEITFLNSDTVYFGNDGGVWRSDNFTDDNPVIYDRNLGYNVTQYYAVDIDPRADNPIVIGGTQDNGSHISLGEGLGKFKKLSGADGSYCRIDFLHPDTMYTSKQYQPLYRFTNGGFEFGDTLDNPLVNSGNLRFINPIEMDASDPTILYQASRNGLQRLSNADTATVSWVKASRTWGDLSAIAVAKSPEHMVFLGRQTSSGEIFRLPRADTTNSDVNPTPLDPLEDLPRLTGFGSLTCSSISLDAQDANHVLISYSNYGADNIWESVNALDAEPRWESVEGDLPDIPVNWVQIHPQNPDVAYAATDMGIFYTDMLNGSLTEWKLSTQFPVVRTDMIRVRESDLTMVAGTHGRGIFTAKLDPNGSNNDLNWIERGPTNVGGRTRTIMIDPNDPTGETLWAGSVAGGLWYTRSISTVGVSNVPTPQSLQFSLAPNPVKAGSSLTLDFELQAADEGQLLLQDLNGNLIQQEAHVIPSGRQQISWQLSQIPAGVYLISWEGQRTRSSRKLIIH
jgi:hypothetical protein